MLIGIDLKSKKGYENKEQLVEGKTEHFTIKAVGDDQVEVKIGSDTTVGTVDLMELKQVIDVLVSNMPTAKQEGPTPRGGHQVA